MVSVSTSFDFVPKSAKKIFATVAVALLSFSDVNLSCHGSDLAESQAGQVHGLKLNLGRRCDANNIVPATGDDATPSEAETPEPRSSIVWLSIDPNTGDIHYYPNKKGGIAEKIEERFRNGDGMTNSFVTFRQFGCQVPSFLEDAQVEFYRPGVEGQENTILPNWNVAKNTVVEDGGKIHKSKHQQHTRNGLRSVIRIEIDEETIREALQFTPSDMKSVFLWQYKALGEYMWRLSPGESNVDFGDFKDRAQFSKLSLRMDELIANSIKLSKFSLLESVPGSQI